MKSNKLHITLVVLTALLLILPLFQQIFKPFKISELHGVTKEQELPKFAAADWIDSEFQPRFHQYLLENYGFREDAIRLYNQVRFSVFGLSSNINVTIGKNGFLFEPWFIHSYYGRNFRGNDDIEEKVKKLKSIQDSLKAYGKDMIMVIAAGKASYYPEHIPDKMRSEKSYTNYQCFLDNLEKYGVNTIDCNQWFVDAKDTTKVPLFPKTGTHWSIYGAQLAADSIVKYYKSLSGKEMNEVKFSGFTKTDQLKYDDRDIEMLLNLSIPLDRDSLAYPEKEEIKKDGAEKPNLFVISDSFFWNIFNFYPIHKHLFNEVSYWYYFSRGVYPAKTETDLQTRLSKSDLIMFMSATSTLDKFGWGSVDSLYSFFHKEEHNVSLEEKLKEHHEVHYEETYEEFIARFKEQVRSSESKTQQMMEKAKKRGYTFEEMLDKDAHWLADRRYKKDKDQSR